MTNLFCFFISESHYQVNFDAKIKMVSAIKDIRSPTHEIAVSQDPSNDVFYVRCLFIKLENFFILFLVLNSGDWRTGEAERIDHKHGQGPCSLHQNKHAKSTSPSLRSKCLNEANFNERETLNIAMLLLFLYLKLVEIAKWYISTNVKHSAEF